MKIVGDVTVEGILDAASLAQRSQILSDGEGLIAETFSRQTLSFGNAAQTPGVVYSTAIALLDGDPIRRIVVLSAQNVSGLKRVELAILAADGTRIATTGDVKDAFADPGVKRPDLVLDVTGSGLYYCSFLAVGETVPMLGLGIDSGYADLAGGPLVDGASRLWAEMAGQTEIPDVVELGVPVGVGTGAVWFGVAAAAL